MKRRFVSLILFATMVLVLVFCGCKKESKLIVVDKDGNTMLVTESFDIAKSGEASYQEYLYRVMDDAVRLIQTYESCSESDARDKLMTGGYTVYTAFDIEVYEAVDEVYRASDANTLPFGCAVMDLDGNVCTLYSAGKGSEYHNYSLKLTSPHSSFKPLSVYAQAMDRDIIDWSYMYEDSPYKMIEDEDGNSVDWPSNATNTYSYKDTTICKAITESLNTIAVKCLADVGVIESIEFLTMNFGINLEYEYRKALTQGEEEVIGNIALGNLSQGVSPLDMAGYYQIFATNGLYKAPTTILRICNDKGNTVYGNNTSQNQVIKESTACIMNLLMQEVVKQGTGIEAQTLGIPTAGKTGTGDLNESNWFVGVNPQYSCAVWHGEGSRRNLSPKIFSDIMARVYTESGKDFDFDTNITEGIYCVESGMSASAGCPVIEIGYYITDKGPVICDKH